MSGPWIAAVIALSLACVLALGGAVRLVVTREPKGSHSRPFADPADISDPDGALWLRAVAANPDSPRQHQPPTVHHELRPFPAAGMLEMLPPDPPPADTIVQAIAVCELGQPVESYLDELFADAEREIGVLAEHLGGSGERCVLA